MTAQCALYVYMGAMKIFWSPRLCPPSHGYFSSDCPRLRFCQLTDIVRVTNFYIVLYYYYYL